jgi:uncharacterized protein (DUF4415 family)
MKKDYDLKSMKPKRRGALIPKGSKIMKTLRLDADILGWLMQEADSKSMGYQTLINTLLREAMQREPLREEIRKIVREELKKAR